MLKKVFVSALRAILMVGCITAATSCVSRVPVSAAFWQDHKAKVAVAVATGDDRGHFYKQGGQGLLDIAISSAMTQAPDRALGQVKPTEFYAVRGQLANQLKKQGYNAVEVKEVLHLKDFPKLEGSDGSGHSGRNYSKVLSEYQADYLIVLNLDAYGAVRPYYGFIPLGAPSGYAYATGFMVKNGEKKPLWHTGQSTSNQNTATVEGDWDQGPEFKNLVNATNRAIGSSRGYLTTDFFTK